MLSSSKQFPSFFDPNVRDIPELFFLSSRKVLAGKSPLHGFRHRLMELLFLSGVQLNFFSPSCPFSSMCRGTGSLENFLCHKNEVWQIFNRLNFKFLSSYYTKNERFSGPLTNFPTFEKLASAAMVCEIT